MPRSGLSVGLSRIYAKHLTTEITPRNTKFAKELEALLVERGIAKPRPPVAENVKFFDELN
ncbi:MAG: hypothetical protein ACK4QL_08500 [Pseudanabaenaceae cyanobacterium]